MKVSANRLLFGTDEVVPEPLLLRAGPLDLALAGGKLLQIRLGDVEVWHGVSFLYRDPDWGTPQPIVERLECAPTDSGFRARYQGCFPTDPVIGLTVDIEGTGAGTIRLSAEAVPAADIATNRLGICLMHPMAAAGARIEVEHVDGRLSQSTFPALIPPWPPFMLIRAIRHEYADGCWARCELAGDVFELEDQRNNSDASFKTYSRSNLMPRPYWLRAGVPLRQSVELKLERSRPAGVPLRQSVELKLERSRPRPASRRPAAVTLSVGDDIGDLPKVGIEIAPRDAAFDHRLAVVDALRPALLHLSLDEDGDATVDWRSIRERLAAAGAQLRLDITIPDWRRSGPVLESLATALRQAEVVPESLAIFPSEQPWIAAARKAFPHTLIGGGTSHFFVQLNRLERLGAVDFLTFTTSPIVHVADDTSVMLSLQSLGSMIATLRARYPALPIRVGPSGIGVRKSPLGGQPVTDGTRRVPLARHDPRSRALFGAAWWLGYVARFAYAGVDAITLASFTGESGVAEPGDREALPCYPPYCVLARLGARARISSVSLSDDLRIAALALRRSGERELLLANLTGAAVDVQLDGWPASCEARILDAGSCGGSLSLDDPWAALSRRPASPRQCLEPYALASLRQASCNEPA